MIRLEKAWITEDGELVVDLDKWKNVRVTAKDSVLNMGFCFLRDLEWEINSVLKEIVPDSVPESYWPPDLRELKGATADPAIVWLARNRIEKFSQPGEIKFPSQSESLQLLKIESKGFPESWDVPAWMDS